MIRIPRESKAVMPALIPIRMMVMLEHEKDVITTSSSPIKSIVGG